MKKPAKTRCVVAFALRVKYFVADVLQVYVVMECGDYDLAHALHMCA